MRKTIHLILGFTAIALSPLISQNNSEEKSKIYSPLELKEDFAILKKALEEAHPALYRFTPKPSMDSLFVTINNSLKKEMSEMEFYRQIAPVFSKVKCGHTRIAPPDVLYKHVMENGKIFPFDIKIIEKKIYVSKNLSSDTSIAKGTEILTINKISATKILSRMLPFAFADGNVKTIKYRTIEKEFFLFYLLAIGEPDKFEMEMINPANGKKLKTTIGAISMNARKRNSKPLIDFSIPSSFPATAVLKVRTFNNSWYDRSGIHYNRYIDSVFALLKRGNVKKLIIDLRGNGGGNPELVAHLYKQFADSAFNLLNYPELKLNTRLDYFGDNNDTASFYKLTPNPKGTYTWNDKENDWYGRYQPKEDNYREKIYLLLDGESFSSSGFFASIFRYNKRGKIIGEESGGSCRCNDCHGTLVLPNTGLKMDIARCAVNVNLNGTKCEEHGIIPDILIEQTVSDFIKDKDTVLEFALKNEN